MGFIPSAKQLLTIFALRNQMLHRDKILAALRLCCVIAPAHARSMDAHARSNAIFYAGSRVYLSPKFAIGDPGALTPDESLNIPMTRQARRELLKEKRMQLESQQSRRSLTAKQEKRQKKKLARKLAIGLNENSEAEAGGGADNSTKSPAPIMMTKPKRSIKDMMASAPKEENDAVSRTLISRGERELTLMEDPANWEQRFQAGCSFWYNLKNHKIRKEMPLFKGRDFYPDTTPERYSFGTGCTLYERGRYLEGKQWTQQVNNFSKARPHSPKLLAPPKPKLPPLSAAVDGEGTKEEEAPSKVAQAAESKPPSEEAQPEVAAISTTMAPVDAGSATAAVEGAEEEEEEEEEYSDDEYHDEFEEQHGDD